MTTRPDVAIAGGGLAGLATAIGLARRQLRVVCIETAPWPRPAVGESLEFSAPRLLAELGVEQAADARRPHLFPKTSVRVVGGAGCDEEFTVWPPTWFSLPPIWCSRVAFHTDRTELDHLVLELAIDAGVEILPERVTTVETDDDCVEAVVTNGGSRVEAAWFVDASGHVGRLVARALELERELLGDPQAAYWARFDEAPDGHATGLYFPEPGHRDLTWAWEIPLNEQEVSVGVVMSAERLARFRAGGAQPREIFEDRLRAIPRLNHVIDGHPDVELHATSYTPYRHRRTIGPNWLLVGDASAMVDPLTSNGVTSALRHADQAARTISVALDRGRRRRDRWAYEHTAPAMVATLDRAMESFLYEPEVRRRLGLRWAVTLYAATGVITNSLYAKLRPTTVTRATACAAMLAVSRAWTRIARCVLVLVSRHVDRDSEPRPPAPRELEIAEAAAKGERVGVGG
ncbi:MAG: NAD(P)/FAD-dependent oxidoreductase [Ilumatobacter sp.]|uniref:NAD(P)/FAD-dependent oxidoreductase n=1 Tax=Ilumatobacter sp. TaxID=1967498 RepID=UPI00261BD82D|nr:NAD(P)/FAD-dependent oxidoreductase [Ilumatobacter sp.]MDJ0771192.1 NAD(P)/FAD-dependent oxidoreductase [Ilumatobacter sp.]